MHPVRKKMREQLCMPHMLKLITKLHQKSNPGHKKVGPFKYDPDVKLHTHFKVMFSSKTHLAHYLFTTRQNPLHTAVIIRNKPQEIKNPQLVLTQ